MIKFKKYIQKDSSTIEVLQIRKPEYPYGDAINFITRLKEFGIKEPTLIFTEFTFKIEIDPKLNFCDKKIIDENTYLIKKDGNIFFVLTEEELLNEYKDFDEFVLKEKYINGSNDK
jgi:hypothetical protein